MKGQISVEHLVLLGVVIAVLIPGVIVLFNTTIEQQDAYEASQINNIGNRIVDAVNTLYALGEESKKTVKANFPDSFRNLTIEGNKTIIITYVKGKSVEQAVFVTDAKINGAAFGTPISDLKPGNVELVLQEKNGGICISHLEGYCFEECGNNIIDGTEVCDGSSLGNLGCSDFGMISGSLVCNSNCDGYVIEFCSGCQEKTYCLDDNIVGLLNSPEVVQYFGTTGGTSQISHGQLLNNPGLCGPGIDQYRLRAGGGIKLDLDAFVLPGDYKVKGTLKFNPFNSPKHFAVQCDGHVVNVRNTAGTSDDFEVLCPIKSSNPDIRLLGYGSSIVGIDQVKVQFECEDAKNCNNRFDSGFECLAENHQSSTIYGPGYYESDYVIFRQGFNAGFSEWDSLSIPVAYQDRCEYTYHIDPAGYQGCAANIAIENLPLDPINPTGEYELMLNVIAGKDGVNNEGFRVECGSTITEVNDEIPFNGIINPLQIAFGWPGLTMQTYTVPCRINDVSDSIKITPRDCNGPRVEFESFRLRKKC